MDIDRLDIAIETQAKQASSELTSLYNNLGNIATALNRTSTGYRSAAREVGRFAASMRAISGVQGPDISKTLSQLSRLKRLSNMQTFDPSKFDALTNGLAKLGQMPDVSRSVNGLVNGLTRLSKAGSGMSEAVKNLPALGQALRNVFGSLGQTDVGTSVSYLVSGIARLGTSAPKIQAAAQALPLLTAQLRAYIDSMANAPQVSEGTVRLVEAFAQLSVAGKRIGSIGSQVSRSMNAIDASSKKVPIQFNKIQKAANLVIGAFKGVWTANKTVVKAFEKIISVSASVVRGIGSAASKIVGFFSTIGKSSQHVHKATLSLKNLLQVSLGFYGIRSLINFGKQAVELASDLTEVQNVVENSFGTKGTELVEEFAKSSIKSLGMSELTAKQVASRFQAMGNAMGITSGQVANATKNVADRMSETYDRAGDGMGAMSLNLTRLAADMSSFYNVEQDTVAEALNAVYTGQTRPLRQFGLDLTQATLAEWAMKQGLDADISSMSQAEKTLLRYQYVMANTATVQGDFARTSKTWANQVRILRQNFEVFGRVIGDVVINAFRPLIVWLNAVMERVIAFAETIGNALGKIFGWKIMHTPASNAADVYDTLTDSLDGTADAGDGTSDALKDAKKAAEAYKNTVLGFDELNKLNDVNESTSTPNTGGGSGSGGAGGGLPGADGHGAEFTVTREQSWFEDYKSEIDTLEKLGEYISEKLTNAMNSIQWNAIFDKARGFGTGLAQFLNGLIKPELFGAIGSTIGNAINTVLNAEDAFLDVFKFDNLGKSIGTGINSFFDTYDFALKAKTFYKLVNGVISTIKSAADEIKWGSIGKKISNCVKDALAGINWTNAYAAASSLGTGLANFLNGLIEPETFSVIGETVAGALNTALTFLNDFGSTFEWGEFGDSVATAIDEFFKKWDADLTADTFDKFADGTLTAIINSVGGVNWARVGAKIGGLLANIEWKQLLAQAGTAVATGLNSALQVLNSFGEEFKWEEFGSSVSGSINSFLEKWDADLTADTFNTLASGALTAITDAIGGVKWARVGAKLAGLLANIEWKKLFTQVGTAVATALNSALEVLNSFGEEFEWDEFGESIGTAINKFFDEFRFKDLAEAINKWGHGLFATVHHAITTIEWEKIGEKIGDFLRGIDWEQAFHDVADLLGDAVNVVIGIAKGIIDPSGLGTPLTEALDSIKTTCEGFAEAVDWEKLSEAVGKLVDALKPAVEGFATGLADFFSGLGDLGSATLNAIGDVFEKIAEAINSLPDGAVEKFGSGLARVALALIAMKGVGTVAGVIQSITKAVGGASAAIGGAAAGGAAAGGSAAGGGLIATIGSLLAKLGLSAGVTAAFQDAFNNNVIKAIDGSKKAAEESDRAFDFVKDALRDAGLNGADFLGLKLSGVEAPMLRLANDDAPDFLTTFQEVCDKFEKAGGNTEQFKKNLSGMLEEGVFNKEQAEVISGYIGDIDKSVGDARSTISGSTEVFGGLGRSFDTIEESAEGADEKSGNFKTNFWAMAGGAAIQALTMAVLGSAFKGIGDKAEKNEEKVEKFGETTEEMVGGLKLRADEAREFGGNVTTGFSEGMTTTEALQKVSDAIEKVASAAGGGLASYLDIASPSKLTAEYGKYFDEGLANGIGDTTNISLVETAVKNLVGAIDTKLIEYKDTLYNKGAALTKKLKEGLESVSISISDVIDLDTSTLETNMYNAGFSAAQSFKDGISNFTMPTLSFYISSYDYHDHDGDGAWDSYTPVFSSYWSAYANGGFPNTGEMFIANERGPEMVGRLGNRNVVANNMQIAEAIKGAVVDGMMDVFMATNSQNDGSPYQLNITMVTPDGEVLARQVEKGMARRNNRFNPTTGYAF